MICVHGSTALGPAPQAYVCRTTVIISSLCVSVSAVVYLAVGWSHVAGAARLESCAMVYLIYIWQLTLNVQLGLHAGHSLRDGASYVCQSFSTTARGSEGTSSLHLLKARKAETGTVAGCVWLFPGVEAPVCTITLPLGRQTGQPQLVLFVYPACALVNGALLVA